MKSDKRMIDMLNYLLADELTAIDQYVGRRAGVLRDGEEDDYSVQ